MLMELKNGIKNFFKKLLEGLLGLIILIGVIYYIVHTDWWNEFTERGERLRIQSDATYRAQFLGSEGVELQRKLSLLIVRRDTTTNESELETLNEEIKNTIDAIHAKYLMRSVEEAIQIEDWHLSVEDYERMNRMPIPQPDGGISTPVELKKEWCYSAYQTAYWETAYSHCRYHAKLNDAKAQYLFASILQNGNGVIEDADWAYVWYTIAVLNDYDAAVAARENLLSTLQSREIRSLDQRVIRCINSNFSECGD
jgi:TPR repeat protein